ncbi:MAG TPA: zinc ribbon domain-containing protein, partial [Candidatus Binatia bacterium]|nr:zinc ribbon domain-containing protein [Candidatus Binatia bacterium]
MELNRPLPSPITPEAQPYWDGLKENKLMLPKCDDCGKPFFYPRVLCPNCHSRNISWMQASGRGKLYSFQIAHRSLNRAFKVELPCVMAMIELEEGPRVLS